MNIYIDREREREKEREKRERERQREGISYIIYSLPYIYYIFIFSYII